MKTQSDNTLKLLKQTIVEGWLQNKVSLPLSLTSYFNYRDELSVKDGIVLRGERVVIPASMRHEMKMKVHAGHTGINSCLRCAQELIYWPGILVEIRQYVETCDVCASYASKQPEEPLHLHDVPSCPWQKVGTDIFTISGRNYLVMVDYFSRFFEVYYLQEITSADVITKLKHHFARHGIPDTVISDNGSQYSSSEFSRFAELWGFSHGPISPGNSKANGAAESAVKIAKNLMKKCCKAKEDPYLGLLNIRNAPQEGMETSPVQRLMGRRTKTAIPTVNDHLMPSHISIEKERRQLENKHFAVADRHLNRKSLKPLNVGDTVRVQPIDNNKKEWKQATVSKKLNSHSYDVVADNGRTYRRTRQFLRKSVKSRENFENYPVSVSDECTTNFSKVNYDTNNDSSSLVPVRNDDKVLTSTKDVGTSNNDKLLYKQDVVE